MVAEGPVACRRRASGCSEPLAKRNSGPPAGGDWPRVGQGYFFERDLIRVSIRFERVLIRVLLRFEIV